MRKLLIAGGTLLVLVGCFATIGAVFCSATLHVPRKTGPKPNGAVAVWLVATGSANLTAWWFQQPQSPARGCVMVLHGIADSRTSSAGFAPLFLGVGYAVLAPDSRAHGESGGEFVTYGLLEKYDVVAWAHWMKAQGCAKIYGLGESLGASILLQAISVEPIFDAVVAECAYADFKANGDVSHAASAQSASGHVPHTCRSGG